MAKRIKLLRIERDEHGRELAVLRAHHQHRERFIKIVLDRKRHRTKTVEADGAPHKITMQAEGIVRRQMNRGEL